MIRRSMLGAASALALLAAASSAAAQIPTGGNATPGGASGTLQINSGGIFAGITAGGDCTFASPNFNCLSTNGVAFGNLSTLGTIASGNILANATGSAANAISTTLSAEIDQALGNTQGALLYRGASVWSVLAPGTSGQYLETLGAAANPQWNSVSGGSGCTISGTINQTVSVNSGGTGCTATSATITSTGVATFPAAGALSAPSVSFTGTPITGGTTTTTFPLVYINAGAGATALSTSGTMFGINAPSGFAGNLIDVYVNGGGTSVFNLSTTGSVRINGSFQAAAAGSVGINGRGNWSSSAINVLSAMTLSGTPATSEITGTGGSGSNIAGGAAIFSGGPGTGTGTPGTAALGTAIVGTTGSTLQSTYNPVLRVDANSHSAWLSPAVPTVGTGLASVNAGSTDVFGSGVTGSSVTSVTINFKVAYASAPTCNVWDSTNTSHLTSWTTTTGTIVLTMTSNTGETVGYECHGA